MEKSEGLSDLFPKDFTMKPIIPQEIIERLQYGSFVDDIELDQIYPPFYQFQSAIHWTPISVAQQIAVWIKPLSLKTFIDIGCGVGKLCILLRIITDYQLFGIEQRQSLVTIANKLIKVNKLTEISIQQMNMLDLNWDPYDIYYLYNPFQEHLATQDMFIIEKDIELKQKSYDVYLSEVLRQLHCAKAGKILITFHGYGGSIPREWRMIASKHIENGVLTMWIKEA